MVEAIRAIKAVIHDPQKAKAIRGMFPGLPIDKEIELRANNGLSEARLLSGSDNVLEIPLAQFIELKKSNNIAVENKDGAKGYSLEDKVQLLNASSYENSILGVLNNVKNFWRRAFGRKTGMFSWILSWTFQYLGFNDIDDVEKVIKQPSFVQGFAEYYKVAKNKSKEEANDFLKKYFEEDKSKQIVAKLALKTIKAFKMLPKWFVGIFPPIFCIQNILVPPLLKFFFKEEGKINKVLNVLFIGNPWIDEFVSTTMGVFNKEIKETKSYLKSASEQKENKPTENEDPSPIDSIVLTDLNEEQYKLRKALDKVNEGLERLLGRKSNVSSLIVYGALRCYGFKDYQDLANKTIKKEGFVQELHKCLTEFEIEKKKKNENETTILNRIIDKHFSSADKKEQQKEQQVAKIALAVILMANNLSSGFVDKGPKRFGMFYSFQYLFMPIVSKLIGKESFIGKALELLAVVNPLLNDFCLDPVATFSEEVKAVQKETESIKHLLPQLPKVVTGKPITYIINTAKSIWNSIREFVQKFGKSKGINVEVGSP